MSSLTLERLLFDPSDNTGPITGSYLIDNAGAIINTTSNALDVYLTNTSVAVTASDLDIRDLTHASDSVKIGDGTDFLAIDGSGYITVNINGTPAVSIGADADDAASSYNPISVGGTAYDQANALGALSAAGDRGHLLMDLYRRVFINDAPNRAYAVINKAVTDAETDLVTPLAGRTRIMIQNVGSEVCEIIPASGTYGAGLVVAKGATLSLEAGQALDFKAICATGKSTNVRVFEMA